MGLTKKHFKRIAEEINTEILKENNAEKLAVKLAEYFATENPNFDRQRFLTACGVKE